MSAPGGEQYMCPSCGPRPGETAAAHQAQYHADGGSPALAPPSPDANRMIDPTDMLRYVCSAAGVPGITNDTTVEQIQTTLTGLVAARGLTVTDVSDTVDGRYNLVDPATYDALNAELDEWLDPDPDRNPLEAAIDVLRGARE